MPITADMLREALHRSGIFFETGPSGRTLIDDFCNLDTLAEHLTAVIQEATDAREP